MCGSISNVTDHPLLPWILTELGYSVEEIERIIGLRPNSKRDLRPTDRVLSVIPTKRGREVMSAVWWLKLDKDTLKPDTKWATFNCQSRRLLTSKLHTIPPRSYRSIVLAGGFFEWQPVYSGGRLYTELSEEEKQKPPKPISKHRHLIHHPGKVMLLGAMCKHWLDQSGQPLASTGVITLPPHQSFLDIHSKSFPLVLDWDELDAWLDPDLPHDHFEPLFNLTTYRQELEAVPVNDTDFEPIGDPISLVPGR